MVRQAAVQKYLFTAAVKNLPRVVCQIHSEPPGDPRTLLDTPIQAAKRTTVSGRYAHYGLEDA